MPELWALFAPDRVAVVGATERDESIGRALPVTLSSFDGGVPVTPDREYEPHAI